MFRCADSAPPKLALQIVPVFHAHDIQVIHMRATHRLLRQNQIVAGLHLCAQLLGISARMRTPLLIAGREIF